MIAIIADEGKSKVGTELCQGFLSKGVETEYIPLDNIQVKPCMNCGGCNYKSYGRCVTRDDGDRIYPKVIRSEAVIMVSPVIFGSYSFKVKRVLDKFGLLMDRHYYVQNKELVKGGMPGKRFKYFAIGVNENPDGEEAEAFKKLVHETLIITRGVGRAYIVGGQLTSELRNNIVGEVMHTCGISS